MLQVPSLARHVGGRVAAVKVATDGTVSGHTETVPVKTGLSANGMVEITGRVEGGTEGRRDGSRSGREPGERSTGRRFDDGPGDVSRWRATRRPGSVTDDVVR